jgi:hypothetical protein
VADRVGLDHVTLAMSTTCDALAAFWCVLAFTALTPSRRSCYPGKPANSVLFAAGKMR